MMSVETAPRMNYERSSQQFATVSIPDLRNQQLRMIQEDARSGLPPMATLTEATLTASLASQANESHETGEPKAGTTNDQAVVSTDSMLGKANDNEQELDPLIESIVEHYPSGGTPIISIASSECNPHLAQTVGRTAMMLQAKVSGRILLIDSDFDNGGLTYNLSCVGKPGLTEMVSDRKSWSECICKTKNSNVDFVPIGRTTLQKSSDFSGWIGRMLPVFKHDYDYVIVCSGDAHANQSAAWGGHANGSYLIVSMVSSNQTIAKSAVTHLQSHGARMLGCIVSDCS